MSILRRKMFKGGGYAHRGTGITSGLVPRYEHGGLHTDDPEFDKVFQQRQKILESIYPEPTKYDRFGANVEPLMKFFSGLMRGKSYQGGLGGGLEIAGQALDEAAPGFGKAIQERKKLEAANRAEKLQMDLMAYKSAEGIIAARAAAKAKAKPGDTKSVWYMNPDFNDEAPVSEENKKYLESTRRVGTDYILRIKDVRKDSPTFGEYLPEDKFPNYMVTDPVKTQAKKSGDLWIMNPAYEGKDPSNKFLNSKFKSDEFGNVEILDVIPGSPTENDYIPEENFKNFQYTEPKEAIKTEKDKIEKTRIKGLVQDEFDRINKNAGRDTRVLSDAELNAILQRAGTKEGDWNKFSQQYAQTFNELGSILQDYVQDVDQPRPDISIEFGDKEEQQSNVNQKVYDIQTKPDHIDERFDLDKTDPNYAIKRERAMREYRLIDPIPGPAQERITAAFDGFKDLKMMTDNIKEGSYILGNIKRITSAFGLDPEATEFITGEKGTLVSATAALIKGIPSDFDVTNLKATIPNIGQGDSVNIVRAKRLQRMYNDIIKNTLAWHAGYGYRIPEAIEVSARALIGNEAVNEALNTSKFTTKKLQDIQTMSKKEFIAEYGDPFKESINLLKLPDSKLLPTLNEAEMEELRLYEEQMGIKK